MGSTRRAVLGGAILAPFLAGLATAAWASAAPAVWGEASDGWVELWWTPQARLQFDRVGASVDALAPATVVGNGDRSGVRFPVEAASGEPSLTEPDRSSGRGTLAGGLVMRAGDGEIRISRLEGALDGGRITGKYAINGIDTPPQPIATLAVLEGNVRVEPALPGQPMTIRVAEVPVRPAQEWLDALSAAVGNPVFTTETVLAHITAEGRYTPPEN